MTFIYQVPHCLGFSECHFTISFQVYFSKDTKTYWFYKKKINKLLIPFFAFYFGTSFLLPHILKFINKDIPIRGFEESGNCDLLAFYKYELFPNCPIWFLLFLFLVNILFYLITLAVDRLKIKVIYIIVASIMIATIGYYLGSNHINLPMYIDTALSSLPFFV